MHINRKRQSDSQPALDAQSSAQEAQPKRRTSEAYSLQRIALACFGVLGTGGLLALAGCPANLEDPQRFDYAGAPGGGTPPVSGAGAGGGAPISTGVDLTCVTKVFTTSCSTSTICHQAGANAGGGLDLQTPGFEARLLGVDAPHGALANSPAIAPDCPKAKLVDTTTPAASWILVKINGKQGDCGSSMPLGLMLAAADSACITKFVNDEAAAANKGAAPTGTGGAAATATGGSGGM